MEDIQQSCAAYTHVEISVHQCIIRVGAVCCTLQTKVVYFKPRVPPPFPLTNKDPTEIIFLTRWHSKNKGRPGSGEPLSSSGQIGLSSGKAKRLFMSGKASQVHVTAKPAEHGRIFAKPEDPRGNFADLLREVEALGDPSSHAGGRRGGLAVRFKAHIKMDMTWVLASRIQQAGSFCN